jgi:transposase|tara:strand:+ start:597 stop:800 length:204 start_codon:yes stop_codon:yes gene_type:complete
MNRHTAPLYFHKLREFIAERLSANTPNLMVSEIEVDGSYFGGVRKRKRSRGPQVRFRFLGCYNGQKM